MIVDVRYRVLGPVEVTDKSGKPVPLAGFRQRTLLACLLANAGGVVSGDRLANHLWGEGLPSDPVAALQSQVSRLRHRLGHDSGLETVGRGYRLRPAADELDSDVFERLLAEADSMSDPGSALRVLDSALALWRGPAYGEETTDPDVAIAAEHLEQLRITALEQRAALLLAVGRPDEAAAEAAALVRVEPLRESAVEILVEAWYEAGRSSEALSAYESYRSRLAEELGVDPGAELRRLHLAVLRGEADISRSRATLPRPMTSYIGRHAEVRDVTKHVRDNRLVTLTGPGGVGKTRLAIEVARRLAEELPDGVWFCDLSAIADAQAVPAVVAAILGIQRRHDRSLTDRLVEVLGGRRALLVLDNCEHVRDAAAALVQQVVEHTVKVHVLTTSREPLGVPGEQRIVVEPLSEQDGARLFAERARAARPGLTLSSDDDLTAVRRICREVAGLPLGVELAASRAAARTPVEIAADLAGRADRLSATRAGPDRHQSVAAVVDWSLDRLSESERDLAEHLAVFAGGCTAESAAAVVGSAVAETADLLVALVDRSIVVPRPVRGYTRYAVLEPVRARAEHRLAQRGLLATAHRAHASYFADLAQRASAGMRTPEAAHWLHSLDNELANLRAACRWSLGTDGGETALRLLAPLYLYTWARMAVELGEWAEAACTGPAAAGHPALSAVQAVAAMVACRRGDLTHARQLAEKATETADCPEGVALASEAFGWVPLFEGRLDEAIARFRAASDAAREAGDTFFELLCQADIALARAYTGDETAAAAAEEVSATAEALDYPLMVAFASYIAGETLVRQSPQDALTRLRRAVQFARGTGARFLAASAGLSATSIEVRHGDPAAALPDLAGLLDEWQRAGSWNPTWMTLLLCIDVFVRLDEHEPAAQLIGAMHASPTAGVMRGAGAKRLARAEAALRSSLETYDALVSEGASLGDDGAVALARQTLGGLTQAASPDSAKGHRHPRR
ncbi:MAG TPA: BTAD domain-containing putative transcriptional regulator [Mycobacterium sp.]|nr:BTAD domain-containing putative transcriptional regulator [Mycobacterium sp.]